MEREKLTVRISEMLARESGQDQEVLLYSLTLIKSFLMGYSLLFLTSFVFGVWQYALIAAVTASFFRVFSGGAHASSPRNCSIIGIIVFNTLGIIAASIPQTIDRATISIVVLLLFVWAFLLLCRYAPADSPGKPINSHAQKKYLRAISFALLAAWTSLVLYSVDFFLINYLAASMLGLFWQVFTLTPLGYSTNHALDSFLIFHLERRRET